MTAALIEGRSWRCQGLHNETFLPYGFFAWSDWPPLSSNRKGFQLVAALPGG
jgi:hypothetical protein